MPLIEKDGSDTLHDLDRDRDFDHEKDRGSKGKGSAKAKDLSHVPCKFYRVGSCTAGASCPFSHVSHEPGQKDVCAWFVKGNCKFGHKCALAHVLPGQPMSMDRKNKKSAQLSASSNPSPQSKAGGRGNKKDPHSNGGRGGVNSGSTVGRNPLFSGSTAPTRALPSSRPPISLPLKASISPSAPAPPITDTDFTSLGLPDESSKLPVPPAQSKLSLREDSTNTVSGGVYDRDTSAVDSSTETRQREALQSTPSPPSLPLSKPSAPRNLNISQRSPDLGPIGSPPRQSPLRTNGFSPGTSPYAATGLAAPSPFSAPSHQTTFFAQEVTSQASDFKTRSGLAASLGTTDKWAQDISNSRAVLVPSKQGPKISKTLAGSAVEEDNLEEFLPSSLTDLLSPEERIRRMSRTKSGQPGASALADSLENAPQHGNGDTSHHRHSRSVPAPSILGDLKSIWENKGSAEPGSPDVVSKALGPNGLGSAAFSSGTPSSFKSSSAFGGRSFTDESAAVLTPSNASGAFLPGLHHNYLNAKSGAQRQMNVNSRASAGLPQSVMPGAPTRNINAPLNDRLHPIMADVAFSPPRHSAAPNRNVDDYGDYLPALRSTTGRPIPGGVNGFVGEPDERRDALSPSARALQAHAPGQSLPQGLAAGYSRIHAQPPPPSFASPSSGIALSPGQTSLQSSAYHDWAGDLSGSDLNPNSTGSNGLEAMFSHLSFSAANVRPHHLTSTSPPLSSGIAQSQMGHPGSLTRSTPARGWQGFTSLSPLSKPAVTNDDDDVFSFDDELRTTYP